MITDKEFMEKMEETITEWNKNNLNDLANELQLCLEAASEIVKNRDPIPTWLTQKVAEIYRKGYCKINNIDYV